MLIDPDQPFEVVQQVKDMGGLFEYFYFATLLALLGPISLCVEDPG